MQTDIETRWSRQCFFRLAQVARTNLLQETFDSGSVAGWRFSDSAGRPLTNQAWRIEPESGGNWVLSGTEHNWANLVQSYSWGDFRLRVRVKLLAGSLHLNYRLGNEGRYFIGMAPWGMSLSKQYWPSTFFNGLAQSAVSNPIGVWHTVEIAGLGPNLKVLVNGALRMEYTDPAPLLKGSIAFETLDGAHVHLDEITVIGAPAPPCPRFTWVRTGGPLGGIGYDVRVDPSNTQVLYVTDAYSGVSKSTNGGLRWTPMNQGIVSRTGPSGDAIPVFCLTIDPRNPQVLWCGTLGMLGVYKSTDGAANWAKCDTGIPELPGITFRSFTIDPLNSDIVYAGTEVPTDRIGPDGQKETRGKIFKTTNGGTNWTEILDTGALVRWLVIDPTNPGILYAATGIFDRDDVTSEGILKSTNGGATWRNINYGLPNLTVGGLVMDPRNPQVLYAATGRHNGFGGGSAAAQGGVYKTTDGGETWTEVLHRPSDYFPVTALTLAPSNPDIVYVAPTGNTFFRSPDGGKTWQSFRMEPAGASVGIPIAVTADPYEAKVVYLNSYIGGVFKSTDGGQTWQIASQGYTGAQTSDVGLDPYHPEQVYALGRQGVASSDTGGHGWTYLNQAGAEQFIEGAGLSVNPLNSQDVLIASRFNGTILRTTNGGATWRQVFNAAPNHHYPDNLHGLVQFQRFRGNPNIIYAAGRMAAETLSVNRFTRSIGVLKSMDGGEHWQFMNKGLISDLNINTIAVHPTDPNMVYVGALNGAVYQTTDGGAAWRAVGGNFASDVRALAIDPDTPNTLYAGTEQSGLFLSTNAGQTWRKPGAGLDPNASIRGLVVNPRSSGVAWAADLRTGVYRSADWGETWIPQNDGLRTRAVNALAISADGQVLYAATEGEGVFRLGEVSARANVSGVVRDAEGPVAGATVRMQATTNETRTDAQGRFVLTGLAAGQSLCLSAWKHSYYCAKADSVWAPSQDVVLTLRRYQTNDNPAYQWVAPVGVNSCMSCKPGVTSLWLERDAHAGAATNTRFLTMYNGTDLEGRKSPLTRYGFSPDYGRFALPPDPTQPYAGPGYKLDFPETAGNCAACHVPGAAVNAPYDTNPNTVTGADQFGIHCDFCHKVADVRLNPATGLPYSNRPGVLSMDVRRPFPSDPERYQLFFGTFDDDNVPQEDTYLPLLKESRFCAPCHFGVFWNTTIYNSFGEWLQSPYSDPLFGRTCQACHMPAPSILNGATLTNVAPGTGGVDRDPLTIHAHTFPGVNSQELLQNALTLEATARLDRNRLEVVVTLTNDKTGHHVPTDSPLRHLILLVLAKDPNGQALTQLDGPTVPSWCGLGDPTQGCYSGLPGKAFAKILQEFWTEVAPTGAYWNPTRELSDNRLAAFASDESRYIFAAPPANPARIEVKLLFRRAFKTLQCQKKWETPDILMAQKNMVVEQ
jgi:photosystem II stability/assembly factor-like uncharacterized protein